MAAMAAPASYESVACPNCGVRVEYGVLNEHLDACLAKGASPVKKREGNGEKNAGAPRTDASPGQKRAAGAPGARASNSRVRTDPLEQARPFAERMRPRTLQEYVGQEDVVGGALAALLRRGQVPSMVLWGPPGSGKTTLARLVTREATAGLAQSDTSAAPFRFVEISATVATMNEMKKVLDEAVHRLQLTGQRSVLFIDEIQRLNRTQQDLFLPALEKGHITLLAATTENPSFRLQSALLSRLRYVERLTQCGCPEKVACRGHARSPAAGHPAA